MGIFIEQLLILKFLNMKKITIFLIMLLMVTFGFSQQEVIQDFEDGGLGATFGDGALAALVPDPETGGTRGQVAQLTSSSTGIFFQGVIISFFAGIQVDLTTDKSMEMDVYSLSPITIAPKVINGADGAPDSTTSASHNGSGWETLTFTFNDGFDGTVTANGIYSAFVIYFNWDSNIDNFGDPQDRVFYVDNISGISFVDTCSNGVQDGDETGVDCGGSCGPCPPSITAPTPPARSAEDVFSVYSNAYTGEPSDLDAFGGGSLQTFDIDGNDFIRLSGAPGANLQWFFGIPSGVDLSSFTHYHMDFYFEGDVPGEGAIFLTIIQGFDENSNFTGNTLHNVTPTETGAWLSLDIPISTFNGGTSVRTNIGQMQLAMAGPAFGPTYVDNVYFHKNTTLSNNTFSKAEFKVYPNPSKGDWNIRTTETIKSIQVYNITGRLVREVNVNASEAVINTLGLSSGVYLAKVSNELDQTKTIKLIKE
jgi:hypothetical protein